MPDVSLTASAIHIVILNALALQLQQLQPLIPITETRPNPACQVTQEKAQTDLAAELAKKYPDSYATQKMLLDSGMEAFNKLCQVPSDPISDGVLRKLVGRYYPSYGTVLMLYENEMKAYKSLQK